MIWSFKSFCSISCLCLLSVLPVAGVVRAASLCPGDVNGDNFVTIDELVLGVGNALDGCGSHPSPSLPCGDGEVQSALGEECDGGNLAGESCETLGFDAGNLACTLDCRYDMIGCQLAGGLLKTGQTQCDLGTTELGACPGSPAGQDGQVSALGVGAPLTYVDGGNGTITDQSTGLVWEKLSNDGSIHDADVFYTWTEAMTLKIAALNTSRFAGYDDWRLPNRRELESLVHAGRFAPAVAPLFHACSTSCTVLTCSCTQSDAYWTSTSFQEVPSFAWAVNFNYGDVTYYDKAIGAVIQGNKKGAYVRAVRGGR